MKYWRGYLVAAIVAVFNWALIQFAKAHSELMDMVYPYMTRIVQNGLVQWSNATDICLWQLLLLFGGIIALFTVVLMVIFHWNPVQWFGWVLAVVTVVQLMSTSIYGLNLHAGSIAEDVRIPKEESTVASLEDAATYYLEQANIYANQISRDSKGQADFEDFAVLAQQAQGGFKDLTYEQLYPVFAGNLTPVKKLGWSKHYTKQGVTGMFVPLTGEAAVNPNTPDVALPFVMCREMSRRMSIATYADATFAAYLACVSNESVNFKYSGYLMAYHQCRNELNARSAKDLTAKAALQRVESKVGAKVSQDLEGYEAFLKKNADTNSPAAADLFVSWHVQTVVIPNQPKEEDTSKKFNPLDKNDDRLVDLIPATTAAS